MTAEAQVREAVSKVEIEDNINNCVFDMSSYHEEDRGPPKVGGEVCNGVITNNNNLVDDAIVVGHAKGGNCNGKDDADGSYVFVSRCSSANHDDLVSKDLINVDGTNFIPGSNKIISDEEFQVGDFSVQNDQLGLEEDHCIVDSSDVVAGLEADHSIVDTSDVVAEEGLLIKPAASEAVVALSNAVEEHNEAVPLDGEVNVEGRIQDLEANRDSPPAMLSSAGGCESLELDISNVVSEELNNLNSTAKLGDDLESQIVVPSEVGVVNVVQSGHESQDLILKAGLCEPSVGDEVSSNSAEQDILDSNEELKKSQECQVVVAEDSGCLLPEVEVENVKFEERLLESGSAREVEEGQESQITTAESVASDSYEIGNGVSDSYEIGIGVEKLDEENKTYFDMKKENSCSENVATDIEGSGSDEGKEPERLAKDTNIALETEVGNDIFSDENKDNLPTTLIDDCSLASEVPEKSINGIGKTVIESAEFESYELGSRVEMLEQNVKTDFGMERENLGSENLVADVVNGGSDEGEERARLAIETSLSLETEFPNDLISDADTKKSPTFHVEDSIFKTEVSDKRTSGVEAAESQSCELESVEVKLEEESKTDLGMERENVDSENGITDTVDCGLDQDEEPATWANGTNIPLETENGLDFDANKVSLPTFDVEGNILQNEVPIESMDGIQNGSDVNFNPENAKSLPSPAHCMISELHVGQSGELLATGAVVNVNTKAEAEESNSKGREEVISYPVDEENLESEVEDGSLGVDKMSCPANGVGSEIEIAPRPIDPEEVPFFACDNVKIETEVPTEATECTNTIPVSSVHEVGPVDYVDDILENGRSADAKLESDVEISSATNSRDIAESDDAISRSVILFGSIASGESGLNCVPEVVDVEPVEETEVIVEIHRDGISTTSPGSSTACASDTQNAVDMAKRPFRFLIRMPRYDDAEVKDQIRCAQLQVDEKTKCRDAVRAEMQRQKVYCQDCHNNFEAAKSEVKAAKGSIRLKYQEIDSVQFVLNRVKNAFSVEDIDGKIHRMEHMIVHETLPLKEEKQFIREIKQLKHLREELFATMGSQEEVKQALDQKDQAEEHRKMLKKELDSLRDEVTKAEARAAVAGKKFKEENEKMKELQAKFRAADDVRQKEYVHLQSLRRRLYEKNKHFRMYKDDAMAANSYALSGDKEGLHRICINQVDKMMELWHKDEDFRKQYITCNTRSTLRRLRTLDGRSLGPDEEPLMMPLNVAADERDAGNSFVPPISTAAVGKQWPQMGGEGDSKAMSEQQKQTAKETTEPVKHIMPNRLAILSSSSSRSEDVPEETKEEESKITKEEKELARKTEELRKEKIEAKLREQRRLEEKAKAKEALERKKLNAEKAQIRAELRAQKEAEQKEKEREKRAKKKERKKAATTADAPNGSDEGEGGLMSETIMDSNDEPKIKERSPPTTATKRAQKPLQFTKTKSSIPPPLRNRGGKRRMLQQWMWIILATLLVLALFLLGNSSFSFNIDRGNFGF